MRGEIGFSRYFRGKLEELGHWTEDEQQVSSLSNRGWRWYLGNEKQVRYRCSTLHITTLTWLPDTDANMFCTLRRRRLNKNVIIITISTHGFVRPRVKRLLREVAPGERKRRQKQNLRAHLLKELVNQPVRKSAAWEVKNQETISQKSNEERVARIAIVAATVHELQLFTREPCGPGRITYLPSSVPWNFKAYILNCKIGIRVPQRAAED